MRKFQAASVAIAALMFITAYAAHPLMPERMASHWNIAGEVDGHMQRDMGVYFMPFLGAAMLALFFLLPSIDPKKANYAKFQKEYDELVAILMAFMLYIYLLTLAHNAGIPFNLLQLLSPAFGALFIYMGIVLGKARQNWFVGIRTPWTMSSETVWEKTHALGSKLFKAAGAVALLGIAAPQMFAAAIAVVIAAAVATFAYSYVEYQHEARAKGKAANGKR